MWQHRRSYTGPLPDPKGPSPGEAKPLPVSRDHEGAEIEPHIQNQQSRADGVSALDGGISTQPNLFGAVTNTRRCVFDGRRGLLISNPPQEYCDREGCGNRWVHGTEPPECRAVPGKYKLRDYQAEAVDKAIWHLKNYPHPFIIQAATGAGKSLMIADICHKLNEPVLILQPSKEILEQNYAKLVSYDPMIDAGIYSASKGRKEIRKFTYATIGSIRTKPEQFKHFRYVILDECHLLNPKNTEGMLTKFMADIGVNNVCGLTATPYRIVQKYFKEDGQLFYTAHLRMINRIHPFFWKNIVYKIETADLIRRKYLAPIVYRRDHEVNLEELEVNSTGADFTVESLEKFWSDSKLQKLAGVIQKIDKHCQQNLIFMSSLKAAARAREMLGVLGIESHVVDGKTPQNEREQLIEAFKAKKFKHMLNVGVFTTGFDVPSLDCVTLARPTMSLALYYQMVGRGVRIDPERPQKVLRVYDLAGVSTKLGAVETIRVVKEDGGFKDKVISEAGDMTEQPLFKFIVKKNMFGNMERDQSIE